MTMTYLLRLAMRASQGDPHDADEAVNDVPQFPMDSLDIMHDVEVYGSGQSGQKSWVDVLQRHFYPPWARVI